MIGKEQEGGKGDDSCQGPSSAGGGSGAQRRHDVAGVFCCSPVISMRQAPAITIRASLHCDLGTSPAPNSIHL